jgi:hypothetical protein
MDYGLDLNSSILSASGKLSALSLPENYQLNLAISSPIRKENQRLAF